MSSGTVTTTLVGLTDVGMVRTNNEDMFLISEPDTGRVIENTEQLSKPLQNNSLLLVVSDGMGGYEGGEVASQLTIDVLRSEIGKLPKELSPQSRLEAAVEEANRQVWLQRQSSIKLGKMGATATVMFVEQDNAYIAEVGDSRAYILRDGRIKQLTTDQTMIQMMIDAGAITPEAAAVNKNRNILLQAIGTHEFLQIAVSAIQIQAGDVFLLCSDGLSGKLQANEMKEIIQKSGGLDKAAAQMIDLAKQRGGEDNITVILAKFEGNGLKAKVRPETLTKQIQVLAKFDPVQEAKAKPKREIRPATFQDWLSTSVIDAFARSEEQRARLGGLGEYGEYIVFRKGDLLISQGNFTEDHYWLVNGQFRVMLSTSKGDKQTVAFLVSPTDRRNDTVIQGNEPFARVRRQFFIANLAMLQEQRHNATIRCEDDENAVIKIQPQLFQRISAILGERFINTVRHS
jgi:PPM family protein phosphatase